MNDNDDRSAPSSLAFESHPSSEPHFWGESCIKLFDERPISRSDENECICWELSDVFSSFLTPVSDLISSEVVSKSVLPVECLFTFVSLTSVVGVSLLSLENTPCASRIGVKKLLCPIPGAATPSL